MLRQLLRASRRAPSLWRRYWQLPATRRAALWRAAGWIVVVRASLQLFPFRRILKLIEDRSRRHVDRRRHAACSQNHARAQKAPPVGEDSDASTPSAGAPPHTRPPDSLSPSANRVASFNPFQQRLPALGRDGPAGRTLWAVRATGHRLLPERPCLTQALVGRLLLSRHGVDAVIQIGVMKDEAELKAHAWLEHEGVIILGGAQSRDKYQPFPALQV